MPKQLIANEDGYLLELDNHGVPKNQQGKLDTAQKITAVIGYLGLGLDAIDQVYSYYAGYTWLDVITLLGIGLPALGAIWWARPDKSGKPRNCYFWVNNEFIEYRFAVVIFQPRIRYYWQDLEYVHLELYDMKIKPKKGEVVFIPSSSIHVNHPEHLEALKDAVQAACAENDVPCTRS